MRAWRRYGGAGLPAWTFMVLATGAAGCSGQSGNAAHQYAPSQDNVSRAEERVNRDPVPGLPFAQGRAFASLDDYLAFLRERGKHDVPWYREIGPGLYELVSRRGPGATPRTYTRAELERKFGFRE